MKTILVPTDYSASAKNAALYALKLASQLHADKIVFYNAYQAPPVIAEQAVMPTAAAPFLDIETYRDISSTGMQHFKQSLENFYSPEVKVEELTEYAAIDNEINNVCKRTAADIIVMGITGTSKIEEVLIGSTAINVIHNTKIPVIIVPSNANYTSINNVMLACDFTKVMETTPVKPIKSLLDATKAALQIVNIYENSKELDTARSYQQELLRSLLKDYNPTFSFVQNKDFITGVNDFVEKNMIDLIITIPKKHGFFEGLFKESHTKKLAFHSHVPMMCVHEDDL